jgi:hypothetical protein
MPINPVGDARLGDTICTRLRQAKGLDVDLSEFRSMTPTAVGWTTRLHEVFSVRRGGGFHRQQLASRVRTRG